MLIGSVTFFYADGSKSKGIDADDSKDISDAMRQAAVEVFSKDWQLVHLPGPDVAQINLVAVEKIGEFDDKKGMSWEDVRLAFIDAATRAVAEQKGR